MDASDIVTQFQNTAATTPVTANGQSVSAWRDKSLSGLTFTSTGLTAPTYNANSQNGLSTVAFASASTQGLITTTSVASLPNGSASGTYFCVTRSAASTASPQIFFTYGPTNSVTNQVRQFYYSSNTYPGTLTTDIYAAGRIVDGTDYQNAYSILSSTMVASATGNNGWDNGNVFSGNATFPDGASLTSMAIGTGRASIGFGRNSSSNDWWLNGNVAEILVFSNVLTTVERQQIEGYLAWKWGLQASLPSTHPYSSAYSVVRPFLRAFQPTDLPTSCLFWFDGGDATTLTLSGSNVTTWRDKSGNANNFTFSGNFPTYNATTGFLGMIGLGNYGTTTTPITLSSPTASTIFTVAVPTFPNNVGTYYNFSFRSGSNAPQFFHGITNRHSINGYYIERNPNGNFQFIGQGSFGATAVSGNGTSVSYTTNTGIPADTLTTGSSIAITSTPGLTSTMSISTISGAAGVVTVTFATSHPFSVGQHIAISGVSVNGYNTVNSGGSPPASSLNNAIMTVVASVPNSTSITYANTTTASASGGTVVGTYDGIYATSSYNSGTGVLTYPNTLTATSAASLTITGATGNGTLATVTFTNPVAGTPILFAPGQMLSITGVNPSSYNSVNGDAKVISATSNTVTYTRATSATYVSGGTIRSTLSLPQSLNGYTWIVSSTRSTATNLTFSTVGNITSNTSNSSSNTGTHTFSLSSSMTNSLGEIIMYDGALSTQERQRVEGYLLWKWGSQRVVQSGSFTTVSTTHPFYRFPSATVTPFNLRIISGLNLWIDALDSTSFTTSSGNLTQIKDKSDNNYTLTPTSAAFQYVNTFNTNYPSFFGVATGGNGVLGSIGSFTLSNPSTLFAVFQNTGLNSGTSTFPYLFNITSATNRAYAYCYNQTTTPGLMRVSAGSGSTDAETTVNTTTTQVFSMEMGASSTRTYQNGTLATTSAITGGSLTSTITIGGHITSNAWTGHIAEVIIYNAALTFTQRQQIEGYLAWKWRLYSSLPTTHPYYKVPYY